ncbi:hypothetical protein F5148DRAFT_1232209 [Russula earlei]|uniref:Uncharacterized protein n=1 Tax=Russula earlei TaxID=71964 RepID=A0ACC0TZ36_9AGAM|nr:hypothetical protein F5148DRAFT_1232209 [Russula earlei]
MMAMAESTAPGPIASSSSYKPRKSSKKHKERYQQIEAVSPDADADAALTHLSKHNDAGAGAGALDPTALASTSTVPAGNYDVEFGDFDYDAVRADDDGVELWLVRAPNAVKARSLQRVEISSRMSGLVGDLHRKSTAYDLWALEPVVSGGTHASRDESESGDQDVPGGTAATLVAVGAEELRNLSVLLPCKRREGKLYLARKPVTRHLVVATRPARPTKPDTGSGATAYQNPKREAYPEEVLTHRFHPYGDLGDLPPKDHVNVEMAGVSTKEKRTKRKGGETGSQKKKKARLDV